MKLFFILLLLVLICLVGDPYARVCVPNKVKNMNVKVFNLMSGVNEEKLLSVSISLQIFQKTANSNHI